MSVAYKFVSHGKNINFAGSNDMSSKHELFMRTALAEAEKALATGEFPVGSLMVYENKIISRGRRSHSRSDGINELDHAEVTALRNLVEERPEIEMARVVVYTTMEPCLMCYATLLLNGIRKIVYGYEDIMGGGTNLPLLRLNPLYQEMKAVVIPGVLRKECLLLFKDFFSDSRNTYWRNSRLAEYTLAQATQES
jgi:tRNA(adenine34) deaminase